MRAAALDRLVMPGVRGSLHVSGRGIALPKPDKHSGFNQFNAAGIYVVQAAHNPELAVAHPLA
jgi:hypothetical protein